MGPNENLQFLYVLLDRALIITPISSIGPMAGGGKNITDISDGTVQKRGLTTTLTPARRQVCARYFKAVKGRKRIKDKKAALAFAALVQSLLEEISHKTD